MNLSKMKYIILLGFCVTLNITLRAKPVDINLLKANIITSDTSETNNIIIPTVFSPNGDGLNDLFNPSGNFNQLDVKIYNCYGALIYTSIQLNEGWNGRTTAGQKCIEGTYFYIINTNIEIFRGSLTLIR